MLLDMRLEKFMVLTCSTAGCNSIAVIELRLENYQIIRVCGMCETAVRRRYRDAEIMKL